MVLIWSHSLKNNSEGVIQSEKLIELEATKTQNEFL